MDNAVDYLETTYKNYGNTDSAFIAYIILNGILVNNLIYFPLNSEIHNKLTRNTKCLYVQQVNLLLYQNGVYYVSI